MVVAAMAFSQEQLDETNTFLRSITSSMKLITETGEPDPLAKVDVEVAIDFGPAPDLATAERVPDGPSVLFEQGYKINTGSYQLLNMGIPIELTIPDSGWYVHPNQLGFLVIADEFGTGPGFGDLRVDLAMTALVPVGAGEVTIGEPIPLSSIADLLDNPPPNLTFSNVDLNASIDDRAAIRFDLTITDPDDCWGVTKPCTYGIFGPVGQPILFFGGHQAQIWIVEDVPNAPLTFISRSRDEDADAWFARSDALMDSIRFLTP
jgi:hypothetical protein